MVQSFPVTNILHISKFYYFESVNEIIKNFGLPMHAYRFTLQIDYDDNALRDPEYYMNRYLQIESLPEDAAWYASQLVDNGHKICVFVDYYDIESMFFLSDSPIQIDNVAINLGTTNKIHFTEAGDVLKRYYAYGASTNSKSY